MSGNGSLRQRLADGQVCVGVWSSLPGPSTAEMLARTGADYVVIDLQHGPVSEGDLPGIAAAVSAAGSTPLVRTRSAAFADVGRPLDLGSHGVIVPSIRDLGHAREVVAACRYAPEGDRSIGRLSGGVDQPLVILMVETAGALADLDAILALEGIDGIYVGPGDLSLALQLTGTERQDELRDVLSSIIRRACAARIPVGVHAYSGDVAAGYAADGATIVTATADSSALADIVGQHLATVRATTSSTDT